MIQRTYWKGHGRHKIYLYKLDSLILTDGSVYEPTKNPALVRFRTAWVLYYELHAEHIIEQDADFATMFNINVAQYRVDNGYDDMLYEQLEYAMDDIILVAAREQKLIKRFLGVL